MSRLVSMIIFITIASTVYFGIHYFVFKSLTRSILQSQDLQKILAWLFWISGLSFIAHQFMGHTLNIHLLGYYAYTWMGVIAIAFFFFLLQRGLAKFFPAQNNPLAIFFLVIIGLISLYSLFNGMQTPRVKTVTIPVKQLPQSMSGFTIVQLSDMHLDGYKGMGVIAKIVARVNALKPDLIVITGDLIDGDVSEDPAFCQQLKQLTARHGVLAITGNHEYYAGLQTFLHLAQCSNITVLRNQAITLSNGLQVIGLEDDEGQRFNSGGPDLEKAMVGCDASKPIILLYHRPFFSATAIQKGVDLQLSGHTHAGQIPPMDLLVWLYYKYPAGLYEKDGSYIYTSPGTGYWGPAMRFLSKSEITLFRLVP